VTCYLLHIMEDPDRDAYRDADLKDVVGLMPRFFCAQCQPLRPLLASEAVKCMRRSAPCWRPAEEGSSGDGAPSGSQPSGPGVPAPGGDPYTF
jgi:hypothetical protein